ncbi:regulation of nuclear pre-mRNA domain-containing protein 2 [Diorhabda carinulata]|uniref:regulation of nuclear pre-mRNA domain-containing protein 2 n=1 Tax=Diorhabda carinulata TaxID=1163345 RepID=UPI0025A02498|nr:regulation of nuclear pre-mRNA domain-containing protein 2 [Diorhabda carinulata]
MGTQTLLEGEFNVLQFEKQLTTLKDSQEAINNCCQWCLQNRAHHKKIVNAWLNVLKRVKVEQRLILFYLANDVVQYSKRRNLEFVESWGIALQKATTMVRDEKVKHKILRIFKIWEQRCVYNEEFISDLCGLLSVLPSAPKNDEPHEFQPNYVINKIKNCAKLEKDTDTKLKLLKEHNPKIQLDDGLITSLKDRAHMDDVEKEIEVYITHMEEYMNALKLEIKNRITLISVLKQAESQLEADRKDVKVVANAYKMFGTRVKTFQRKLEEHKETLTSPIPSPDVNAPSPSPDSDLDLPEETTEEIISNVKEVIPALYNPKAELQFNAGYYTPVQTTTANTSADASSSFLSTNGFSSFIGSETFNLENFSSSLFSNVSNFNSTNDSSLENEFTSPVTKATQIIPVQVETPSTQQSFNYDTSHIPLLPPPMPPFSKSEVTFGNSGSYGTTTTNSNSYGNTYATPSYDTTNVNYTTEENFGEDIFEPPIGANPYPPSEEYNPEDEVSTWEPDPSWNGIPAVPDTDTPESPPMFEKEGYNNPIEYHDAIIPRGVLDVDHRVLPGITNELEDSMGSLGTKDVDHRNLISLTGSPGQSNSQTSLPDDVWNQTDQDYRIPPPMVQSHRNRDQDYRLGFNLDQLKLPPPPPPPTKFQDHHEPPTLLPVEKSISPPQVSSPENVDMDMSDDEGRHKHDNLKVIIDGTKSDDQSFLLEPPPPLPELLDDVDTNNFLDDLNTDVSGDFGNMENLEESLNTSMLLPPPPMMNFNELVGPPLMPPPMNSSLPPPPPLQPPPMMMGQSGLVPHPNPWIRDEELDLMSVNSQGNTDENNWSDETFPSDMDPQQLHWMGHPMIHPGGSPGFRGRGNRGFFIKRGRGRGGQGQNFHQENFRGNFRGHWGNRGGNNRGNRGFFQRGGNNFRGNFRGGF